MGNATVLLAMLAASAVFSLHSLNGIGDELKGVTNENIPLTQVITNITEFHLEQSIQFERSARFAFVFPQDKAAKRSFNEAVTSFDALIVNIIDEIKKGRALSKAIALRSNHDEKGEDNEHNQLGQTLRNINKKYIEYIDHSKQVFEFLADGNTYQAIKHIKVVEQEEVSLDNELKEILSSVEDFSLVAAKRTEELKDTAFKLLSIIALATMVIGLIINWRLANYIVNSIRKAAVIASGDLTQDIVVTSKDEMGVLLTAMNVMKHKLRDMISGITDATAHLSLEAQSIHNTAEKTGLSTEKQQIEMAQVATAMTQMMATVQDMANNTSNTAESVSKANQEASDGRGLIESTVLEIETLVGNIDAATDVIHDLESHSAKIGTVLDVIEGIAEQTNLLALNAAIEAARAGDLGRGFAVVADEVRTLAGRTQTATEEISQMIYQLQAGSKNAVVTMNRSREDAHNVVKCAAQAQVSFATIAESVSLINEMNMRIASSAEEHIAVSIEINDNITQVNNVANETAKNASQNTYACEKVALLSQDLKSLVNQYKV